MNKKNQLGGVSRMKVAVAAVSFVALFGMASTASAVTVDFEGFAHEQNIENVDLGGVALSIAGPDFVRIREFFSGPPLTGSRVILGNPVTHANPYLGQFLGAFAGNVNFVSIALGDYGSDEDNLFLRAYNATNTLIGTDSALLPAFVNGGSILSINVAGIDHIEFGSTGTFPNSVFADNLTFTTGTAPIPEPSTILLLGSGLVGLIGYRWKKSQA